MAKQKTHSGAKKRFKLTGTGKVKRGQAKHRHNLTVAKTHAQKKRLSKLVTFKKADEKNVKAMLPNG